MYNLDTGGSNILKVPRKNNIHNYNSTMVNVDTADHLR